MGQNWEEIKTPREGRTSENEEAESKVASLRNELSCSPNNIYIEAATSSNTRKAYRSDIRQFEAVGGLLPATTELIVKYLHEQASTLNPRTLERRLISLKHWHIYQGFSDPINNPIVKKTLKGIKNIHGRPKEKAPALTLESLECMVEFLKKQNTLGALRNNALLQVGFFGAFRRSELVAICFEHLNEVNDGIEILIPRSKTDQPGEGQICALPYGNDKLCAVSALKAWIKVSKISTGPIFGEINRWGQLSNQSLSHLSISLIVKSLARQCNLPHANAFSAHSLRRGLATSASQQGASLLSIMRQGRWKHQGTVYGYVEEGQRFLDNAASIVLRNKQGTY